MKNIGKFIISAIIVLSIGTFTTNASADLANPIGTPVTPLKYAKMIIKDYKGNIILETTSDYWVAHQDEIEKKYRIGKFSPNKMIVNYLKEKNEMPKSLAKDIGKINENEADQIIQDMLMAGVIENVTGKIDVYKLTEAAKNKKPLDFVQK